MKGHFIKNSRRQRIDALVYMLSNRVAPTYQERISLVELGYHKRRMDKAESGRHARAAAIPLEEIEEMIKEGAGDDTGFDVSLEYLSESVDSSYILT